MLLNSPDSTRNKAVILSVSALLSGLIFMTDLLLPLGIAGGVPYVAVVLLNFWVEKKKYVYITVITTISLVVLGYYLSPVSGIMMTTVISNRILAIFGILAAAFVVLKYKQSEEALKEEHKFITAVLNTTESLIVVLKKNGRILRSNHAFEKFSRHKDGSNTGIDHLFGDQSGIVAIMEKVKKSGKPVKIETELEAVEDNKTISWTFSLMENNFIDHDYLVAAGIDITDLKNAEISLKKANHALKSYTDELRRSNGELEQFAYVASHDLQEPLRMVASYTQLLGRKYKSQLDQEANEFIEYAVNGAKRMQALINDLLQYSRIGTKGKDFQPVDCNQIVEEVMLNLKSSIDESGADIVFTELPVIKADDSQMLRLYQNLISNAIKFRTEETPEISIGCASQNGEWIFSVKDNGIGIDPKYADKVFNIFQRLHAAREYPGTGIGLAVCKKIVERHGGKIWFESVPGEGSTFYFSVKK